MCVLREERQPCAKEVGDFRGGDLSKEVQAPEGWHLHLLRGQRWSDREGGTCLPASNRGP